MNRRRTSSWLAAGALTCLLSSCVWGGNLTDVAGDGDGFGGFGGSGASGGSFDPSGGNGGAGNAPVGDGTPYGLTAPSQLTIDGQSVESGEFVLQEVIAYSFPSDEPVASSILSTQDEPIVKDAVIGSSTYFSLFLAPAGTRVLVLRGYFDAIVPDLPQTRFDVTLFGTMDEPMAFTLFLPLQSSDFNYQVTGVGMDQDEIDNVDTFCETQLSESDYSAVRDVNPNDPGDIQVGQPPLVCQSAGSSGMQAHGSVTGLNICETPPVCGGDSPYCCAFSDPSTGCVVEMHCNSIECYNFDEIPCG